MDMLGKMKKGLALCLVCAVLLTLLPVQALATPGTVFEIGVQQTDAGVDLTALQVAITAASQREKDTYTIESWVPFAAALVGAQATLADINVTQEEVDAATATLLAAKEALVAVPIYSVTLSVAERHTFSAVKVGYSAQVPHSVTVTNTGNVETGDLTVALTGEDADGFTISTEVIPSIAVGETAAFTVRPNTGLAVGLYMAAVTVDGEDVEAQSFAIHFAVAPERAALQAALDAALELDQEGYTPESWVQILVAKEIVRSVLRNENATNTQLANAAVTLEQAKADLVAVEPPPPPPVDKEALQAAVEAALERDREDYTPESWVHFLVAKGVAQHVLQDGDATEEQVAEALELLMATKDDLRYILPFTDVLETHWAWQNGSIGFMWRRGYMTGISETAFGPDMILTRAQVVRILWNMEDQPSVAFRPVFGDVPDGEVAPGSAWYSTAVIWAYENEIVRGVGGGLFAPHEIVSRQEIATMLQRYAVWRELDVAVPADFAFESFPDSDQVSSWALPGMRWAIYNEFIRGTGDGALNPLDTASRAECATILHRFIRTFE